MNEDRRQQLARELIGRFEEISKVADSYAHDLDAGNDAQFKMMALIGAGDIIRWSCRIQCIVAAISELDQVADFKPEEEK